MKETGGRLPRIGLAEALAAIALLTALGWSYAPTWSGLLITWRGDENYSYAFLVVPIAVAIFWQRRRLIDWSRVRPIWWALAPFVVTLAVRVVCFDRNQIWLENLTVLPLLACLVLLVGGWGLIRAAWPAVLFLGFMFPLPTRLNNILSFRLQELATIASCSVLQLFGKPAIHEGNIILISGYQLEVARACSGLSMLLTFVTLITAMVLLIDRPWWERLLMLASAIPIALVCNIARIVATALCYPLFGPLRVEKFAHDFAGWMMMPLGLLLAWLGIALMDWLVVEVVDEKARPLLPGLPGMVRGSLAPTSSRHK